MSRVVSAVRQCAAGSLLLVFSSVALAQPTPSHTRFDTGKPSPVLAGVPGQWDAFVREKVSVMYDGGIYKMWYCGHEPEPPDGLGQDSSSQIGYATSPDGINWTRYAGNPVLGAAQFRAGTDQDISVVKVGATYYMFIEVGNFVIDLATSTDGIAWTVYAGNPLLTGAASPVVIHEGGQWSMFYEDMTQPLPSIYLATSSDGLTWTPSPSNPVLAEATNATVPDSIVKEGSTYHLYYHREEFGIWPAWHATSTNLTTWADRTRVTLTSSQWFFQDPQTGRFLSYFWDLPALTDRQMYVRYGLNLVTPSVWHADEGTGTGVADSSGNLAHGELENGASWTPGWLENALHFDGVNDQARLGHYANLSTWTVAGWVRSPAAPTTATPSGPIDRGTNYRFTWNHTDPALQGTVSMRTGGVLNGDPGTLYTASFGALPADTWVHLAATYDGSTLRAYRNGALVSSTPATGTPNLDPSPLTLGRYADVPQYFQGDVDELYVYEGAISASQILILATDPTPPTTPALTAQANASGVNLSWTAASDPQTGVNAYNIYRSQGVAPPTTLLAQVSGGTLAFQDTAVAQTTLYSYQVSAVNGATVEGVRSNHATVTTPNLPPSAPTALVGTLNGTQASLDWANNAEPDLAGYHVYRATASGGPFTRLTASPVALSAFVDSGLSDGTTYYYSVTAIDSGSLESPASTQVIVSTAATFSYTLAEGATGPFFDLDILLANPNASSVTVDITYLRDNGTTVNESRTLPGTSRTTIAVDQIPGLENTSVSTTIISPSPIVVERTMSWDSSGYGSHTEKATDGAALTWYFAEGSQGSFFQTYVLLANAGATANQATVQFLREGESPVSRTFDLLPTSRTTVDASAIPELENRSFGITVTFTQPGVAERAMYFGPGFSGGHEAAGVTQPSTSWFLAEGATGSYFSTFVLLANAGTVDAQATITYLPASGTPVSRTRNVPAGGRVSINIADEDPSLADAAVATQVSSTEPILVERAQYWPNTPGWHEAHDSFGVVSAGTKWGLAEGRVGGPREYQTYILLANPGSTAANVEVQFLRTNGTTVTKNFEVAATSRFSVGVGPGSLVPELADEEFGAVITSTQPIAVERALYSNANGVVWAAGTNATGTRLP